MLLLEHIRGWSYKQATREVLADLVYPEFTSVGGAMVPDDKPWGRLTRQLGPEAIEKLYRRSVAAAARGHDRRGNQRAGNGDDNSCMERLALPVMPQQKQIHLLMFQ